MHDHGVQKKLRANQERHPEYSLKQPIMCQQVYQTKALHLKDQLLKSWNSPDVPQRAEQEYQAWIMIEFKLTQQPQRMRDGSKHH